jgi:hypothetical protein
MKYISEIFNYRTNRRTASTPIEEKHNNSYIEFTIHQGIYLFIYVSIYVIIYLSI